jgi:hypothetical protein
MSPDRVEPATELRDGVAPVVVSGLRGNRAAQILLTGHLSGARPTFRISADRETRVRRSAGWPIVQQTIVSGTERVNRR